MPAKAPSSTSKKPQAKSRQKPASKKPLSPEERSRRLFKSLTAQIDGGHFRNALKTCDKILRIDAKDADASQAKLFLLLQTEQYSAALDLLQALGTVASHEFEQAYALYRLRREPEAKEVLSHMKTAQPASGVNDRGIAHLEAQLAYRQCAYQEAVDLYGQLLDSSSADSDEHADLITNLNAAQTHLDFLTTGYLHALDTLPSSVINGLETAPPPPPPGTSVAIPSVSIPPPKPVAVLDRPLEKKVRMKRVPKHVIPGVTPPPDPERWLKKSERSTFGQGSGRRRKAGGGATQGAVDAPKASGGGKQQKKRK